MRRLAWVAVFLIPFSIMSGQDREIASLAAALGPKITSTGKSTIAVTDFSDLQGGVTELGRFLAEELSVALVGADYDFVVVDRAHLRTLLAELNLSESGVIDPDTAKELGRIAGVDALITGTLTELGDAVRLSAKVLDTETARIVTASSVNIARTSAVDALLARGVASNSSARSSQRSSTPEGIRSTATRHLAVFENDFLRVKPVSLGVSENKKTVTIALAFENISEVSVLLAVNRASPATLIDEAGAEWRLLEAPGGFQIVDGRNYYFSTSEFSELSPRAIVPGTFQFYTNQPQGGTTFTFSGQFLRFIKGESERVTGFRGLGGTEQRNTAQPFSVGFSSLTP